MVNIIDGDLNAVFGALADPTRRQMLQRLTEGPAKVTDLAKPFSMSLPAVSKHVRVLERARLIRRNRQGRIHLINLDARPISEAWQWMNQYREFWEGTLESLAEYLDRTK